MAWKLRCRGVELEGFFGFDGFEDNGSPEVRIFQKDAHGRHGNESGITTSSRKPYTVLVVATDVVAGIGTTVIE